MLSVKSRPLTVYDYERLPETGPRYQLVEGELHMAPHLVGKAYVAPFDVRLTDIDVYQPDVCFFSVQRYSYLTDAGARGAPDLVVEVLSPGTDFLDLGVKKSTYARTGVREMWVIEPSSRTIKMFNLRENAEVPAGVFSESDSITTAILPGFSLAVAEVFAD